MFQNVVNIEKVIEIVYYNQRNYASVPYPAKGYEKATVATSGCGVCCASMVVENMTDRKLPPNQCAQYAMKAGARVSGGTDMRLLGRCIARDYGLTMETSNNIVTAVQALKNGAYAIVNVGGDRAGHVGLFSDGGHYVLAVGLAADGRVMVLDPNYYAGKFNKAGRKGKVTVQGNLCLVSQGDLAADTTVTSTKYYIFEKEPEMKIEDVTVKVGDKKVEAKLIDDVTYVPLRVFMAALSEGIQVNWTHKDGASVTL